jgi:hypothetical protein
MILSKTMDINFELHASNSNIARIRDRSDEAIREAEKADLYMGLSKMAFVAGS